MRWLGTYRHDPRTIIDTYKLYEQSLNKNRLTIQANGTPCTYYNNTAWNEFGQFNKISTKCFCYNTEKAQPDSRHYLCMGTGVLSGYQKYGFVEEVLAAPSIAAGNVIMPNTAILYNDATLKNSGVQISSASVTDVELVSKQINLTRFLAVDHFLVKDTADGANTRVEYYYSLDNVTWTQLTMDSFMLNGRSSDFATRQATGFNIPEGTPSIWFKVRLRKKNTSVPSPVWICLRFRYRKMRVLQDIYPRHRINEPAFLLGRDQTTTSLKEGQYGVDIRYPQRLWVLPEVNIMNKDIIVFYHGPWANHKFIVKNMERRLHGPEQFETSKIFEVDAIRDEADVEGIIDYLF